jgi:hypothetical protein
MTKANNYYTLVVHYLNSVTNSVRPIGPFKTPEFCVDEAVKYWGAHRPEKTKHGNAITFGKLYKFPPNTNDLAHWEVCAVEIPQGPHGWD